MDNNNKLYSIISFGNTDKGGVRSANEDNYFISPDDKFYVVADGMGGHDRGEEASEIVCKSAEQAYEKIIKNYSKDVIRGINFLDADSCLESTIENAHYEMKRLHNNNVLFPKESKPGSTFTGAIIDDDYELHYTSLGDSRLYLFRNGKLEQLTEDDNIIKRLRKEGVELTKEKAKNHPLRNQIDQYISANFSFSHEINPIAVEVQEFNETEEVVVWDDDIFNPPKAETANLAETISDSYLPPKINISALQNVPKQEEFVYDYNIDSKVLLEKDTLLLCSDGLTDLVDNEEIEEILSKYISGKDIVTENDLSECYNNLMNLALKRGGHDNITVVLSNLNEYVPSMEEVMSKQRKLMENQNSNSYDATNVPEINIESQVPKINLLDKDDKKPKKEKRNFLETMLGFFGEEDKDHIVIKKDQTQQMIEEEYLTLRNKYDNLYEEYNQLKKSYQEVESSMDEALEERKGFLKSIKELSLDKEDLEFEKKELEERCLESERENKDLKDNIRLRIKETFETQKDYLDMKKGAKYLIKKEKKRSMLYGMLAGSLLGAAVTFTSPIAFDSLYNIYEGVNNKISLISGDSNDEIVIEEEPRDINTYRLEINTLPRRILVNEEECSLIRESFDEINLKYQREISNVEEFTLARENMEEFISNNCKQ